MLRDEKLAQIGYASIEKFRKERRDQSGRPVYVMDDWDELSTETMMELTMFATAVREAVQDELVEEKGDEKTAERFRESVERAFQQMMLRNVQDVAAWYTLRDWLKNHSNG